MNWVYLVKMKVMTLKENKTLGIECYDYTKI